MNYIFKNETINYDFFNNKKPETILFLHGWGGNKNSFLQTINLLKNQYNILTITMPTILPTTCAWTLFDYLNLVKNILHTHSISNPIIICHSFGLRVAMLLNKSINIKKIIITGGAGLKKDNIFIRINKNFNKIALKSHFCKDFYKKIASSDYLALTETNKETFKNIVNLNLKFAIKFNCPMLLFWGKNDKSTPLWIAKILKRKNNAKLVIVDSDHFAYLHENSKFNHNVLAFLK